MLILTGGAGFIGSALVAALNARGETNILVVDNLAASEKWKNLVGKKFADYLHKNDFFDVLGSNGLPTGRIDAIVHLGACTSTTETNADYVVANNYHFSRKLLEWAVLKRIRFIYASSAAIYGDGSLGFDDRERQAHEFRPLNVYGYSKALFDSWLTLSGMVDQVAGVRFFNVYGPNEYHKGDMASVVFKAHRQIQASGTVRLFRSHRKTYRDGEQKRDFIYVKDAVEVLCWLIDHPDVRGIFNLGTGHAETWNSLANAIFRALGRAPQIEYVEMPEAIRDGYQYFTEAKLEKLRDAGYSGRFRNIEEGIGDYVKSYLTQGNPYL